MELLVAETLECIKKKSPIKLARCYLLRLLCLMVREIVFHEEHFIKFYQKQPQKVKNKIQYVFELIKQVDRVPEKFLKHLTGTDGHYELRIEIQSDTYRIFCCFDEGRLVVLFNGFHKRSQKRPKTELAKEKRLMTEYFTNKK